MAEIGESPPPLRSAMKDPNASPSKKKSVKVGFGSDEEEVDVGAKEKKSFFGGVTGGGGGKEKKERKAGDVEENLRINPSEIDHASWLKKTQSVSVFSDAPWAILKVTINQARNVPQNSHKKCECFVRGNMGQAKYQTKTVKEKENPTWDETFEMPCEPDQTLKFKIYDIVGKGNRTPDISLGFLKVRIKNMRPGKVYDKWYDMKNDETLKDKEKIQIKIMFCLEIIPVVTNKVFSKFYCQPTWVQSQRNPCYSIDPTAAEMRWAVEKMAERIVQWYNSMDSFVADQRWKVNVLDVSMSMGPKELFGYVTYENRSRAPGQPSETMEYEVPDDDEEDLPKQYKQLSFQSFHSIIPKEVIKKSSDSKNSSEKMSLYAYKRRCEHMPINMAELMFKANGFLTDNRDVQYLQTSCIQTSTSNHVVVWYIV